MPNFRQATISSLKGVVVIEDIVRHKNILDNHNESCDNLLGALSYLKRKKPCREVILSTGIGSTIEKLKEHENKDIAFEAKKLSNYWEIGSQSSKNQPTVEVHYDNLTLKFRKTSVNFFLKALEGEEENRKLADMIEKEIFHNCKRLISKDYKKTVRKIYFTLKHEKKENKLLKEGKLSIIDFVKKYLYHTK